MRESIRDQLERIAAEKRNSGSDSEVAKMIEASSDDNIAEEGIKTVTSEEAFTEFEQKTEPVFATSQLFSGRGIDEYVSGNKRSRDTFERYKAGIEEEIQKVGAKGQPEIIAAVETYFKENPGHRNSKAGKLILDKLEQLRPADDEKNESEVELENKAEKSTRPASVEEFEKAGYLLSNDVRKYFYNNESTGTDLEIADYDPENGKVKLVFHEHTKISAQEEGHNVVLLDEGGNNLREQVVDFGDFEKMMRDFAVQGSHEEGFSGNAAAEIENESEKEPAVERKLAPGKIFRKQDGKKIKIIEFNPIDKKTEQVKKGHVRICSISPQPTGGTERRYSNVRLNKLLQILDEGKYQEVNSRIKVGGSGTVWERNGKTMTILRHEKKPEEKRHLVVFRREDGSGDSLELDEFKQMLDSDGWQKRKAAGNKELARKEKEQQEGTELNENEKRLFRDIFVPYAELSARNIEEPVWAEGYSADQRNQLKEIERRRFWQQEIYARIAEFNQELGSDMGKGFGIREQQIARFVDLLKAEVDKRVKPSMEKDEPVPKEAAEKQAAVEQEDVDDKEKEKIENVFLPYAKLYLDEINSHRPEGLGQQDLKQIQEIEKKRFFGSVLPSKIEESNFIRKQAVKAAVNVVQEKIEKEVGADDNTN